MPRPTRDAFVVAGVAAAVHARSVGFGFVGLDDTDLVTDDQPFLTRPWAAVRAFGRSYMGVVDAGHAYYRPVVTATLALDARWSGAQAGGYHATNVALHATVAVLVWALLRRVGAGARAALAAALVFAVHPVLAPAVAWIPGRNDTLLALFALGAWLAYLRRAWLAHLVLFALALLTKETAVVLPVLWAAHAVLLEPRLATRRVLSGSAVAWGVLLAGRLVLGGAAVAAGAGVGARPETLASALGVTAQALAAPWDVVGGLLAGAGKLLLYVRPTVLAAAVDVPVWPGVLALGTVVLLAARVPGVRLRVLTLGAVALALPLLPPLLLTGTLVLDDRLYLPAVGAVLVIAELVRAVGPGRDAILAYGGVAIAVLSMLTLGFEGAYRDRRAFAREAVAGSPRCALAHLCLARSEQQDGRDDAAATEYRAALSLDPAAEVAHNNLAVLAMRHARWTEAEEELRREIAVSPRFAKAWSNLAIVLRRQGRRGDACEAARQALALTSGDDAIDDELRRDCVAP